MARGDASKARIEKDEKTPEAEAPLIGEQSESAVANPNPNKIGEVQVELRKPDGTKEKAMLVAVDSTSGKETLARKNEKGTIELESATPAEIKAENKKNVTIKELNDTFDSAIKTYAEAAGREIPAISKTERNRMIKKATQTENPNAALIDFIKNHPSLSEQPESADKADAGPKFVEVIPDPIYSKGADAVQKRLEELQGELATSTSKNPEQIDKIHEELQRLNTVLPIVKEVDRVQFDEQAADMIQETLDEISEKNKGESKKLKKKIGYRGKQILGTSGRINALNQTLEKEEQELLNLSELFEAGGETTVAAKSKIDRIKQERDKLQEKLKILESDTAQLTAQNAALEKAGLSYDTLLPGTDAKLYDELVTQQEQNPDETQKALDALLKDEKTSKKVKETILEFQKDLQVGSLKKGEVSDVESDDEINKDAAIFSPEITRQILEAKIAQEQQTEEPLPTKPFAREDLGETSPGSVTDRGLIDQVISADQKPIDDDEEEFDAGSRNADTTLTKSIADLNQEAGRTPPPESNLPSDVESADKKDAENLKSTTIEKTRSFKTPTGIESANKPLEASELSDEQMVAEINRLKEEYNKQEELFYKNEKAGKELAAKEGRPWTLDEHQKLVEKADQAATALNAMIDKYEASRTEKTTVDVPIIPMVEAATEQPKIAVEKKETQVDIDEHIDSFIKDEQEEFHHIIDVLKNGKTKVNLPYILKELGKRIANLQKDAETEILYNNDLIDSVKASGGLKPEQKQKALDALNALMAEGTAIQSELEQQALEEKTKDLIRVTPENITPQEGHEFSREGATNSLIKAWESYPNDTAAKDSLIAFGFPKGLVRKAKSLGAIWQAYNKPPFFQNKEQLQGAMNRFLEEATVRLENTKRDAENKPTVESVSGKSVVSRNRETIKRLSDTHSGSLGEKMRASQKIEDAQLADKLKAVTDQEPIKQTEEKAEVATESDEDFNARLDAQVEKNEKESAQNTSTEQTPGMPKNRELGSNVNGIKFEMKQNEQGTFVMELPQAGGNVELGQNAFLAKQAMDFAKQYVIDHPDTIGKPENIGVLLEEAGKQFLTLEKQNERYAKLVGEDAAGLETVRAAFEALSPSDKEANALPETWNEVINPKKPSIFKRVFGNPAKDQKDLFAKIKTVVLKQNI